MAAQMVQNNNLRLKVVEAFDNGGITQMRAGAKYGTTQPTISQAAPFFLNDKLWGANRKVLESVRPITTSTGIILLRKPLAEAIQSDGKEKCIVESSDGVTSRVVGTDAFLQTLQGKGMKMTDGGLVVFERAFTVSDEGSGSYRISIENPNESVRTGYINAIPADGWTETGKHPVLFGQDGESLKVYLWFSGKDAKIGFASAGIDGYGDGRIVYVGGRSGGRLGVLVKEQDLKALAAAVKTTE
ncbi:Uncharacterised protein [uncultured archaeon]|nr:Uncharacterised protein [uncultured archaeon]